MNQEKAQPTDNRSPGGGPSVAAALFAAAVRHHQAGALDEAERGYRQVLDLDPKHADSLHYLGVIAHQRGKNELAAELVGKAIATNDRDTQSHYHFALVLGALGRSEDAIEHYRTAIALFPNHVSAHLNVALALLAKRQWDEAGAHCRRVLEITPNHPAALNSLGLAFQGAGKLDQAAACFQAALQSKPDMVEALNNHAKLRLDAGNAGEALALLVRALGVRENDESQRLLTACLTSGRPLPATDAVRKLVLRALQEGWTGPDELAGIAESFIKIGPAKEYLHRANEAWPARLPAMDLFGISGLGAISGDVLLRTLLETVRNSDIEIERLLTASRAAILTLAAGAAGELERNEVLGFCCALARQCFINEYVWSFSEGEMERARRLRDALATAAKDGKPFSPAAVAIVAAYFPLHSLDGADLLLQRSWPAAVSELLTQQVREPQAERELRASMPRLTPIEDEVSRAVQQQYEEHPFPRWVKLARPGRARTLNRTLREMFPQSGFVEIERDDGVEFLIAGCGTGQQSIERAQAFAGAKFTAIDLSMASLCYAKRKTRELGIANVDYAQADILKLGSIGRSFDAIESSGVLVAIGDPWGAWRTLISLLQSGGVMSIGLYSEVARRNIVAAQKYLAAQGYRATEEDMRRGRQDIMALDSGSPVKQVTNAGDFFTMSSCRDMLFHVQEHRFALPQIKDFLAENGLVFLGFALDEGALKRYAERFSDDPARTNLDHWHQFEQENPDTFISMYQFWVQKPRAVPTSTEAQG